MPAYHYIALNTQGNTEKGVIEADNDKQARIKLRAQGLNPLKLNLVHSKSHLFFRLGFRKIRLDDLALITQQLATLFAAGLAITDCLQAVAEQTQKQHLKAILMGVRSKVLEGLSLAQALAYFPYAFSSLFCETIKAAEETGHLDQVLNRLTDFLYKKQKIHQKIQQAFIYPSLMILVAISITGFLLSYVVPKIINVFNSTNQVLPNITLILLAISHYLSHYGLFTLLIIFLCFYIFKYLLKKEKYKSQWHQFLLKIPFLNLNLKTINTARFARTFGILVGAGVPILQAMQAATEQVHCIPIHKALNIAILKVREGIALNNALKETQFFSPMTIHLIAGGEASGTLAQMLERAAENQDQALTRLIDTSLALLEPIIILVMGVIVLFIVLAILLPIFNLDQLTG